jgi:hypothetical protein
MFERKYKNVAIFGEFSERSFLENAVAVLKNEGFRNSDISFLAPKSLGWSNIELEKMSQVPEGVAAGASTGAVLGGALGWLIGIGALAIPGIGPFIAAGPIMALLAGAGLGSGVGGLTGGLIGAGMSEYEAKRVIGGLNQNQTLLAVHCDNRQWTTKAKNLLTQAGAKNISTQTEKDGWKEADAYESSTSAILL